MHVSLSCWQRAFENQFNLRMEYKGSRGQQSCLLSLFVYIHTGDSQQKLWYYSIRQDSPYPRELKSVKSQIIQLWDEKELLGTV